VPQIEVTFDIDANGILSVTAKDKQTNKQQSITITGASTLAKDEVERMVQDAEANAAKDKEKLEQIETKNQSENLCYQLKKQLDDVQDAAEKQKIESLIADLESALQKEDYAAMKNLVEQATANLQTPAQPAPNGNDDVIETDFSTEK
jgi:molecular chaperone DnaK